MKTELNQEIATDNTFSKVVKVNALALGAVKGYDEVAKVLGIHRNTLIAWRNYISLAEYIKYNETNIEPEMALKRPMQNKNNFLNVCLFANDIYANRNNNFNLHDSREMEQYRITLSSCKNCNFAWFREETGSKHWVLYNTAMFEVRKIKGGPHFLHYKEGCALAPEMPINASSCAFMFAFSEDRIKLDLTKFNTEGIVDMRGMFAFCHNLKTLDTSMIRMDSVINATDMFRGCRALTKIDLRNAALTNAKKTRGMFASCVSLKKIITTSKFSTSNVLDTYNMFFNCFSLPNYRKGIMAQGLMSKSVKDGGYLTYVTGRITAKQRKLLNVKEL